MSIDVTIVVELKKTLNFFGVVTTIAFVDPLRP